MAKDRRLAGAAAQAGTALLGVAVMCVPSYLYGVPAMLFLLPLLPWLMALGSDGLELTQQSGHRLHDVLCMALAGAAMFCATYPASLSGRTWLAAVWIALCFGVSITQTERPLWRIIKWTGLAVTGVVITLIVLLLRYQGEILTGLAEELTGAVRNSQSCDSLLLTAYRAGYAGLEGNLAILPAMQIGDAVVMTEEVRVQLLYGLRTTLEYALESLLPTLLCWWVGITVLLGTVMPDIRMRRRGEKQHLLPPFERWFMPRGMGIRVGCLWLGTLLPYLTDQPVWLTFGQMCGAAFYMAFLLQGASTLHFLGKRTGMARWARWAWTAGLTLLLPVVLVLLGLADQATGMRGLRNTNDQNDKEDL